VADGGRKPGLDRVANAKSIGWAIYAAGFFIWLLGYLSAGRAPVFDWVATTPYWISSFVPNRETELGLALMFASMVTIYWRAGRKRMQCGAAAAPKPSQAAGSAAGGPTQSPASDIRVSD